MSIRSRLLSWLLPTVMLYVLLIGLFFYYNWYNDITKSFRANLKSITVSVAENIDPQDILWLNLHLHDPFLRSSPIYQKYVKKFLDIQERLPVDKVYIVKIEPVRKGEPVLLDKPQSPSNMGNDGINGLDAYRQVILLDPSLSSPAGSLYDFSETNEHTVYFTKKPLITPIYESKLSSERHMTGYAPIFDQDNQVMALLAADINLQVFDKIHQNAIFMIVTSSIFALSIITLSIFLIANRISQPVQQLNDAALNLAAGDYEGQIQIGGPKEIVELANTLNTMRECLLENISQLRDNSLLRERLYGEYECALLLQHHMLDQTIEDFHDSRLEIKHIQYTAKHPHGLLLNIEAPDEYTTIISLQEALMEGFAGMSDLLKNSQKETTDSVYIKGSIDHKNHRFHYTHQGLPAPLIWSSKEGKLLPPNQNDVSLNPGDYLFLINLGFASQLHQPPYLREWFSKVLRHFSKEQFELLTGMLISELNFMTKKQPIQQDLHILCFHLTK